ncbi:MAG: stage III sporulation protein AF [Bacillota bacterium]
MLDAVRELVRNIAVIILLTSFLEMLISNNEMTKYVRLVMGLFIIVAVLSPVMSFLDRQQSSEVMTWQFQPETQSKQLATILDDGKQLSRQNMEEALEQYRSRVEGQIRALALLAKGVDDAQVSVELQTDAAGYPQAIDLVRVVVSPVGGDEENNQKGLDIDEINPVQIGSNGGEAGLPSMEAGSETTKVVVEREQIIKAVKATVSSFYGLAPEKIMVFFNIRGSDKGVGSDGG